MASSSKFWLLLTGFCFVLTNIFTDELFNSSLGIGTVFLWLFLFIVLIIFLISCILKKNNRKYIKFCSLFLIFSLYNPFVGYLHALFDSPVMYEGFLKDDRSGVHLVLRKNSQYEIESTSILGSPDRSSGRYKLSDNKVVLINKPEKELWIGDTLYIHKNRITYLFNKDKTPDTSSSNSFAIKK